MLRRGPTHTTPTPTPTTDQLRGVMEVRNPRRRGTSRPHRVLIEDPARHGASRHGEDGTHCRRRRRRLVRLLRLNLGRYCLRLYGRR